MNTHTFRYELYGQLAFSIAVGLVPGDFLTHFIENSSTYKASVLTLARKMNPDVTPNIVIKYLTDISKPTELWVLHPDRECPIFGKYSAVAYADFILRSTKNTPNQLRENLHSIMENGRLYENGHLRTVTHKEIDYFIEQVEAELSC